MKKIINYQAKILEPIIKLKCYKDESPVSYLIRLAKANGYNSYKWLITLDNLVVYNRMLTPIESYHLLKKLVWTGFNEAIEAGKVCSYPIENLNSNNVRYCSLCLKESSYLRIGWQMKTAFICLKHKVWLKDICPVCKLLIKYTTGLLDKCSCGADLTHQSALEATDNVYFLQYYLFNNDLESLPFKVQMILQSSNLTVTEKTDYCFFMLRWLPRYIIERREYKVHNNSIISQLKEQIIDFSDLFMKGASGFWRLINQLNKLDNQYRLENKPEKLLFTNFYQQFYKKFSNDKFLLFKKLIEKYIKNFWKKQLTYRNILFNTALIKNHPWIPINQAVKDFRISLSDIRRAIKDKQIMVLEDQKKNRVFTLLYKPSIKLNIDKIKDGISFKEVIKVLGVTKKQLNQLVLEGYFPKTIQPKKNYSFQWLFSLQEVSEYLRELLQVAIDIKEDTVSIANALRIIGSRIDNPLPKLLKKIKDQEIAVTINNHYRNIKALAISKRELNEWIQEATNNHNKDITIPQLAKILNINQQLAYQLVNNGLIDFFIDKQSKKRLITEEALNSFNVKYIFLSQITKAIGINSRVLVEYFAYKNVFPVDHLWLNKLRKKVYYKVELRDISLVNTLVVIREDGAKN